MANTNMEVTPLTKTKFNQRKYENNRSKNIPSMANEDYLNVVEILNEEVGKTILAKQLEKTKSDTITRSKLTKKLSVYTKRLEGYMLDFVSDQNPKRYKMMEKLQLQINDLEKQRNNTQKQYNNKHKNRNDYFEFRFSITNPPFELRRNQSYGNDLKVIVKDFVNDFLKLDIKIHSYSLHMDQSAPHVHMLGLMDNLTFNQQMANLYGKSFNLHSLQNDFNNFVRNHELFKKYNLDLEHITRGGANEDYKNLQQYKENEKLKKEIIDLQQKHDEIAKDYNFLLETSNILHNEIFPYFDSSMNDNYMLVNAHKGLITYLKSIGIYNEDFKKDYDKHCEEELSKIMGKALDSFAKPKVELFKEKPKLLNIVHQFQNNQIKSREMGLQMIKEASETTFHSQQGTKTITTTLTKEENDYLNSLVDSLSDK